MKRGLWQNKLVLGILISILLFSAFALALAVFTSQHISLEVFVSDENQTSYIDVPLYSSVDNLTLQFTGINLSNLDESPNFHCFEEFANGTSMCGASPSGAYQNITDYSPFFGGAHIAGSDWTNMNYCHDGDWLTSCYDSSAGDEFAYMSVNYTKPANAANTSQWKVKTGTGIFYLNLTAGCWDNHADKVELLYHSRDSAPDTVTYYCNDAGTWIQLKQELTMQHYEEAMIWHNASVSALYDVYAEVGTPDSFPEFNFTGYYNETRDVSVDPNTITEILEAGCNCTGCQISGDDCQIPVLSHSDSAGLLNISLMNLTYSFGVDNCTLYNASAFNISSRDQKTGNLVTTSAAFQYDYYLGSSTATTSTYTYNDSSKDTYAFCKYPAWANISGDMTHTFSASGYENHNFYRYDEPYIGIFNAYLLPTETTSDDITYTLLDESGVRVEGATMRFYRVVDDELTMVHEEESDFAGQVSLYQDRQYKYTITINATGYPFKSFELKPVSTSYTITLTATGTTLLDNPYESVRYRIIPDVNMFNISTGWQNITFEIYGSGFEYFGINLTNHSYSCEPASCSMTSTSSTGGIVSVAINLTSAGGFYSDFFFKKAGEDIVYINSRRNSVAQYVQAARGIMLFIRNMNEHLTLMQRTVIASLITAVIAVVASQVGIAGMGLLLVVTIVNIFWSLPPVPALGFEGVGMIHPAVGLILAIFSIGIYVVARSAT